MGRDGLLPRTEKTVPKLKFVVSVSKFFGSFFFGQDFNENSAIRKSISGKSFDH